MNTLYLRMEMLSVPHFLLLEGAKHVEDALHDAGQVQHVEGLRGKQVLREWHASVTSRHFRRL